MQEMKIYVPTYYRDAADEQTSAKRKEEFDDPHVPVLIRRADGVRIVLGSHDFFDNDSPDIQVERRPNGWAIFLHPEGGGDPSGCVYFVDDGRSFVVPDRGSTPPIQMMEWDQAVKEVDDEKSRD